MAPPPSTITSICSKKIITSTTTPLCCYLNKNNTTSLATSTKQQKHSLTKTNIANPTQEIPKLSHNNNNNTNSLHSLQQVCKQGDLIEALNSFTHYTGSVHFDPDLTYAPVLELCAANDALSEARQIHAHIVKSSNLVKDSVFLNTKLVFAYGKCGSVVDAKRVFDKMRERTVFTWNALIGACVTNGEPLFVIELYREMRISGVGVDSFTFSAVIKTCGAVGDIYQGAELHGRAIKCGCDSVLFVSNSLVSMYAKCNDVNSARKLFDSMDDKSNTVSWNVIISAYSGNGQCVEALELFRGMQNAGVDMNSYTFVAAFRACKDCSLMRFGMEIHANVLKSSQCLDVHVANALITMYAGLGKMNEAVGIFKELNNKDIVTWNSLLVGFVEYGLNIEALRFFYGMQVSGLNPDQVSVLSIVAAVGRLGFLLKGKELHAYAIKNGYDSNLQVENTLIDMYAKCSCICYAGRAFDKIVNKDSISWTTAIAAYAQNYCYEEALELLRRVQIEGIDVNPMMIGSVLLASSCLERLSLLKEVHGYTLRRGLIDPVVQNTLIDAYGECGNMEYAAQTFKSIGIKDIVSWTSMISAYVHNGLMNDALESFCLMQNTGLEPDNVTIVSLLSAVASLSALKKGRELHGYIMRKVKEALDGPLANSLVDMYARCGSLENAYKLFICTKRKTIILWTIMINAYGMHGRGKEAVDLFKQMESERLIPDHITFLVLLYACSHSGLVEEGKKFLDIMKSDYKLYAWPEHYVCLVDLLGRANCLEEAYKFVKDMSIKPTSDIWSALLGACQIHMNNEIGEIAVRKLLECEPENPGNYVLVSNAFASRGRWEQVEEVRLRMRGIGLRKNPGCSWVELGGKFHTFIARDESHPESHRIYEKLRQIVEKLESEGGYVADTKFVLHNVSEEEKVKMIYGHSERLAIAYGLLSTAEGTTIRISKNLRVCGDCHTFCKLVSKFFKRKLIVRDASRFHHFDNGVCSCRDYW